MKDRVPRYPGRVKLAPVAGQANVFDLLRADEPIEAGTALCKGTLLSDATAELLGLAAAEATPDEAFVIGHEHLQEAIAEIELDRHVHRVSTFQRIMTGGAH